MRKQLSFLPEPLYNPRYPSENTLAYKALKMMLSGKKISHPHFETVTGSWRLAAHVYRLKCLGWPVEKEEVAFHEWDIDQRQRNMGLYFLPDDLLEMMRGV